MKIRPEFVEEAENTRTGKNGKGKEGITTGQRTPRGQIPEIEKGMSLVKAIVAKMLPNIPVHADADDLVSCGNMGLLAAMQSYNSNKGASFETYATIRIKGAILDWLRKIDRMPRLMRAKYRNLQKTIGELEQKLGRQPTDNEVKKALNLNERQYRLLLGRAQPMSMVYLDADVQVDGHQLHETIADNLQRAANESLESQEIRQLLGSRLKKLPERERKILAFYYFEKMSFAEIAAALGICESRVCQLHALSLRKLREYIKRMTHSDRVPV